VYTGKEWSVFRNVKCVLGKSGADFKMWSMWHLYATIGMAFISQRASCTDQSGDVSILWFSITKIHPINGAIFFDDGASRLEDEALGDLRPSCCNARLGGWRLQSWTEVGQ